MTGSWLLLIVWAGASQSVGGVAAPTVVPFHNEATCRRVGAELAATWQRTSTPGRYVAVHVQGWRCVNNAE